MSKIFCFFLTWVTLNMFARLFWWNSPIIHSESFSNTSIGSSSAGGKGVGFESAVNYIQVSKTYSFTNWPFPCTLLKQLLLQTCDNIHVSNLSAPVDRFNKQYCIQVYFFNAEILLTCLITVFKTKLIHIYH